MAVIPFKKKKEEVEMPKGKLDEKPPAALAIPGKEGVQKIDQPKKEELRKVQNISNQWLALFKRPKTRYEDEFARIGINALKEQKKKEHLKNRQLLRKYLDRAGYEHVNEFKLTKNVFTFVIISCILITLFLLLVAIVNRPGPLGPTVMIVAVWTGIFGVLIAMSFLVVYVFLDLKIFNRTLALEAVLPDFLQLTSANISAGMPLDKALWFAVRPQFGILSHEIEEVAKATIAGEDLGQALRTFSNRYDSVMLKRTVNLLLEGLDAGGQMAELLNRIAINIQELRLMKREMAANVMTYVIFITFASVVAAPFLFALSTTLANIIQKVVSGIDLGASSGSVGLSLNFNAKAVNINDFKFFSIAALAITCTFSASIINIIRKGNVKEGLKFIPIFVIIAIVLYFFALWILDSMLGGMF
ncbi:MAG: type II secretion system F family protein [Nanoarchaeota archaeon]